MVIHKIEQFWSNGSCVHQSIIEIADSHIMVSGETGNSALALAKRGHEVKVRGIRCGPSDAGKASLLYGAGKTDSSL